MSDASITPQVQPPLSRWMRHGMLLKLGGIVVLALVLLIPLALLMPVVEDRASLRDGAVGEIERDWGRAQTVVGPVLVVPLARGGVAYAFPDELKAASTLVPEQRSRGIYAAVVYTANVELSGTFHRPSPADLGLPADQLRWDLAYLAVAVSDLRGTGTQVILHWGEQKVAMLPGSLLQRWPSGLHAPIAMTTDLIPFSFVVPVHGSEGVRFAPLGVHNEVSIRSSWQNPSFAGAFLPGTRDVSDAGFAATWHVSYYGRDFGQVGHGDLPAGVDASLFGVDLLPGIDSYRCVDRAVRYGVLFIVLAFMSFFLFEVVAKSRIHAFQYAMVGLALAAFFLILLALSELVPFVAAYSAAAAGTIGLVVMYMVPMLKTGRRTGIAAALLAASFGVLYVVLQAEDYALLAGSLVVFAALAATMRLTRKLDWYGDEKAANDAQPRAPSPVDEATS